MFTLFFWILITLFYCTTQSLPTFNLARVDIAIGLAWFCLELATFFDIPGLKFLKASETFTLKNSVFEKIISENEKTVKKARLLLFCPAIILAFGISGWFNPSPMILYALDFSWCINADIAFALATSEERKIYLKEFCKDHLRGIAVGLLVLVGILLIWWKFFRTDLFT